MSCLFLWGSRESGATRFSLCCLLFPSRWFAVPGSLAVQKRAAQGPRVLEQEGNEGFRNLSQASRSLSNSGLLAEKLFPRNLLQEQSPRWAAAGPEEAASWRCVFVMPTVPWGWACWYQSACGKLQNLLWYWGLNCTLQSPLSRAVVLHLGCTLASPGKLKIPRI